MPRTALDAVADPHALLRAAGVRGSYVCAGHSLGGLFVRLYAGTYPRDVLGLVLVDAYSETLETLLTRERWAALVRLNVPSGSDMVKTIPSYGDIETIGYGKKTS
jgi:pimeloyl-ACP methyl ester carboxylesterase